MEKHSSALERGPRTPSSMPDYQQVANRYPLETGYAARLGDVTLHTQPLKALSMPSSP